MDSIEIDPMWGTPSSDTASDDIDPQLAATVVRTAGSRFGHLADIR